MKDTHFSNPHGLDGDGSHYSSAYDMALLTKYAMGNETFKKIFGTKHINQILGITRGKINISW